MNTVISNIFEEMFKTPNMPINKSKTAYSFRPKTNIYKTSTDYFIEANVAGIKKEDISIDIESQNLKISYKAPEVDKDKQYTRKEFEIQSFERNFTIGDTIEVENISASFDNGILRIQLPMKAATQPLAKRIEIL